MRNYRPVGQGARWAGLVGLLVMLSGANAVAQGLPKSQPKLLTIIKEQVKVGRSADHAKFEVAYPAAFEKAKSPDYYLAMTSLTGPSEAWYFIPHESHAAIGETMKREHKDASLSAELNRLARADAEYISGVQSVLAAARPDLSLGAFPDLSKARYYVVSTFRIRPGRESDFEQVAKTYLEVIKRASPKSSHRMYQVMAGMPEPTFIALTSIEDYGELDQLMAEGQGMFKEAKPEELAILRKFADVTERVESNHFEVDPGQSYVPKETRDKDPEFWMRK